MIDVVEAERQIAAQIGRLPTERRKLKEIAGRVLREPLKADRDGPPFDRATLDGVCLRFSDWAAGKREFPVAGTQAAGVESLAAPPEGSCLEIMTGAPLPEGCDCVLPVEDYDRDAELVRALDSAELSVGDGVHPRASDFHEGDVLVEPGCVLTGRELAVAASCGHTELEVTVRPKIAILTTGDELVDVEDVPKPHQVRRSNDLALRASLLASGYTELELNHLPDDPHAISWNLERLLGQVDVIIASGGVSKGKFDFLPKTLEELGVKTGFHGVAQRPGKPMYFGTFDRPGDFLHPEDTRVVAVFALPGNPVSSFTCLHRYVLPALSRMVGVDRAVPRETVALAGVLTRHAKLTLLMPVALQPGSDGRVEAEAKPTNTSGDFARVSNTDGFVEVPAGTEAVAAGTLLPFFRWR